jgi:hypothetical protein
LKYPEQKKWKKGAPEQLWSHINEEILLIQILAVKNAIKQRNLVTLAYKVKCKWENQLKKSELNLRGEGEAVCS